MNAPVDCPSKVFSEANDCFFILEIHRDLIIWNTVAKNVFGTKLYQSLIYTIFKRQLVVHQFWLKKGREITCFFISCIYFGKRNKGHLMGLKWEGNSLTNWF